MQPDGEILIVKIDIEGAQCPETPDRAVGRRSLGSTGAFASVGGYSFVGNRLASRLASGEVTSPVVWRPRHIRFHANSLLHGDDCSAKYITVVSIMS